MSLTAKKAAKEYKSTQKEIICRCCFNLTHIFEVSRFEVLITRFFWACFSKPPDLHVMGVGRSAIWQAPSLLFDNNMQTLLNQCMVGYTTSEIKHAVNGKRQK